MEWTNSILPVAYEDAITRMEARVADIRAGRADELAWLLEHPPLYTAGTSARDGDLLDAGRFPVYRAGRGGQYTYHGPGQRVAYIMLDLKARGMADMRRYVCTLEQWLINALARFGVAGGRRQERIGIWVAAPDGSEAKIAALGVRVRRWVTYHGAALNVSPDLTHFSGIVPCGIRGHGVTSLAALGVNAAMEEVDGVLREEFEKLFGECHSGESRNLGKAPSLREGDSNGAICCAN